MRHDGPTTKSAFLIQASGCLVGSSETGMEVIPGMFSSQTLSLCFLYTRDTVYSCVGDRWLKLSRGIPACINVLLGDCPLVFPVAPNSLDYPAKFYTSNSGLVGGRICLFAILSKPG